VPVIAGAVLLFIGASLLFLRLGQEFTPTLDEKNIVMEVKRIPSTSLSQSQSMQLANETMAGRFPQVAFVFSRTGTPDLAADPMPPNASDTYIMLKPQHEWPDPDLSKDELIRQVLLPHLVSRIKIFEIGVKLLDAHDIGKRRASRLAQLLRVAEHMVHLRLHARAEQRLRRIDARGKRYSPPEISAMILRVHHHRQSLLAKVRHAHQPNRLRPRRVALPARPARPPG
jgi:hypothetical protein